MEAYPAQLGDMHFAAFDREWVVAQREAIVAAFFLERGILGDPLKEILERLTQVHNRHLRGVLGDLPNPGKLLAFDRVEWLVQCRIRRLYSGRTRFPILVLSVPFG